MRPSRPSTTRSARRRRARGAAGALLATGLAVAAAAPAGAATVVTPVADGFVGPLGLAVGAEGTVYVADAFLGTLTAVDRRGRTSVIASGTIGGGVDAIGRGRVVYTDSVAPEAEAPPTDTRLMVVRPGGAPKQLASLQEYEFAENPDAGNTYGFTDLDAECAAEVDEAFGGGIPTSPYPGILESNPYAVAIDRGGYLVADAAGNSIVRVKANGRVSTVAVLPPVPSTIGPEVVEFGAPECVVGESYLAEPVPTDVEVGRDGSYYVSSLPGFPESPGTGSVFRVEPSGAVEQVATGFSGAVDLAVARDGTIYVAELFGGRIAQVRDGVVSTLAEVESPGAVEVARDGTIYATTGVFGDGQVVTIEP